MAVQLKKDKLTRILVFGTFDILHPGHVHFFKQARKLATKPFLIVSVARDVNVKRIKGASPRNPERKRLGKIKGQKIVGKAVLGAVKDYLGHIIKLNPQIIALGYDQEAYTGGLQAKLKKKGLSAKVVRLKAYKPNRFKSSLFMV